MEPSDYIHNARLDFRLEFDGKYLPVVDWDNHKYRYRCMSCYLHSGSEESFATEYAKAKDLKTGPTPEQEEQIQSHTHTKQHQIMWSWARSLK
jgi:hypothetical protein